MQDRQSMNSKQVTEASPDGGGCSGWTAEYAFDEHVCGDTHLQYAGSEAFVTHVASCLKAGFMPARMFECQTTRLRQNRLGPPRFSMG
jgi:hypothetical protein